MKSKATIAMLCITAIVITCLVCGIDGILAIFDASTISGLGGYEIRKAKKS